MKTARAQTAVIQVDARITASLIIAVITLGVLAIAPPEVKGFTTFTGVDPTGFSDLATNPIDYPTWDLTNLTYTFDASFDANWPNARVKDQVRLAFEQWNTANATPDGAVYSYGRANGFQPFGDMRSIVVHELGHVLGMTHPDQAEPVNRNWRSNGGPVTLVVDQNNELMRSWINPGDYNHVLSHDELDAFRYMYGHDLNFTEVAGPANITISAYNPGNPNNWAEGGGGIQWRNPADHSQGMRFVNGFVRLNMASGQPLGLKTLGINWDYQNVGGQPTHAFTMETTGTNNPTPIFHYDNNGPNRFNTFTTVPVDSDNKDNLRHIWSDPNSGDIPSAEIIHVGLEQDVWDWSVVSAHVIHPGGAISAAPLLSFHDWSHTIVTGTPAAAPSDTGLDMGPRGTVRARGIRILASDWASVNEMSLAVVEGRNLGLSDLNAPMLNRLRESGQVMDIPNMDATLGPNSDFFIVLQGTENDLPPELLRNRNFLMLNDHPDLLGKEVFVFARSIGQSGDIMIGNYGLLGTEVITPEPATMSVLGAGAMIVLFRKRRRRRMQQRT